MDYTTVAPILARLALRYGVPVAVTAGWVSDKLGAQIMGDADVVMLLTIAITVLWKLDEAVTKRIEGKK